MPPTRSGERWAGFASECAVFLVLLVSLGCGAEPANPPGQIIDLRDGFLAGSFLPAEPASGAGDAEARRTSPPLEVRAAGQVFALSSSGSLVVPIEPFTGEAVLRFDFRFRGQGALPPEALRVSVLDSDGVPGVAASQINTVDVWTAADVPLAGRDAVQFAVLEATLAGRSQSLELRAPQLWLDEVEPSVAENRQADAVGSPLPNVLIIVLDAARASNVGAYGYPRETTPYIDQLAAEALVFRQAFSECPNTSCSIPNLISGIPFVDTGPPGAWHRLSDEMTTLAEYLGGLGYRSFAFSSNPNNAIARNTSQGFDEFFEMWAWEGRGRHPERRDPHRLSRLANETMRDVDATEPVFMLLHYVPPHEPYAPRPEFDIFGDPEYEGPVYPGVTFRDVRSGQWTLSPADVEEMVALYDGNLRMADDAVREVFDALKADQRWDNSIVLITADHGEAFFEHGVQGHNSTLYDEMLHIPFILRLPTGTTTDHVDTSRLVILSDVVPTVLGQVGIKANPEVGGVDLLGADGQSAGSRVILHRRGGQRQFAARTLRWKALFSQNGRDSMLFDLESDPEETLNLVETRPLLHHGFAALLTKHRLAAESGRFESAGVELPEEDLRELRSLGYIR